MAVPPPHEVLAAGDPAALFGDAAMAESSALKQAYAALIRAYKPDSHPEVFAHIRKLYELARNPQSDDPANDAAPETEGGTPSGEHGFSPLSRLRSALAKNDWDAVDALLAAHGREILERDPEEWLFAASVATAERLFDLPVRVISQRLVDLESAARELPPLAHLDLETLLRTGLAYHRAQHDERVDRSLLRLIREGYARTASDAAQRWLALVESGDISVPRRDALHLLQIEYPLLLSALEATAQELSGSAQAKKLWQQGENPEIGRAIEVPRQLSALLAAPITEPRYFLFSGVSWLVIAGFVYLWWRPLPALGLAVGSVLAILWERRVRRIGKIAQSVNWTPEVRSRLVEIMRESVTWPHEMIAVSLPSQNPLPTTDVHWQDGHPLLELERDPLVVFEVMTPAHAARVRNRATGKAKS